MNQNAYTQMNATIHQDINKVLASGAKILTAGKVAIGTRQGKASGDWNGFVGDGGTDGIEGMLSSLMGGPGEIAGSKVIKGKWNLTNPGEISVPEGNGGRSVTEIMQVVKARTPGLRHIYNKFLKLHPGMAGKVTLQFTILAGGDVVECNIRNSTTQISEFDEEIREAVQRWNFKIIKSGNTTVAMPFNFSE
jgi:TonB family protein